MENPDISNCIWNSTAIKESDVHKQSAVAVERLMKESLIQRTLDNITVVMVSFSGFERANFVTDTSEELRKSGFETITPLLQKSLLNNSLNTQLNTQSEKPLDSPYTPTATQKSFLSNDNNRSMQSSSKEKRVTNKSSLSDYMGNHQPEKPKGNMRRNPY